MSRSTSPRPTRTVSSQYPRSGDTQHGAREVLSPFSRRRFLHAGAAALGGAFAARACCAPVRRRLGGGRTTGLRTNLNDRSGRRDVAPGGRVQRDRAAWQWQHWRSRTARLMIDGGLAANADALLAAVKSATRSSRIHTLINTHWHPEQTGANEAVGRGGGVIFAHEKTRMSLSNTVYSVTFTGRRPPLPEAARPTRITRGDGSLEFGGQTDRLRLHARGPYRRGSLRPFSRDEPAGRRRSRVRGGMASPRPPERRLAGRPRPRARTARDGLSIPTPASCPPMAA